MTETLNRPTAGRLRDHGDTAGPPGGWRPDPGSIPPPEWRDTATDGEKLAFACATLRHYGIATASGATGAPEEVASRLTAAVQAKRPNADAAFVYWTDDDQARSMDSSGGLRQPLSVHAVGRGVGEAATAAFRRAGLAVRDGATPHILAVGG